MSGYDVNIVPHEEVTRFTIVKVQINNVSVILNETARCSVYMFDASNNIRSVQQAQLTTEQYNNWLDDDQYFVNCILANLGLSPLNITVYSENGQVLNPPEPQP
jgi:hypothetical protein